MAGSVYEQMALIDTSAVIALGDPKDQFHKEALEFFQNTSNSLLWYSVNITSHEVFTKVRYMDSLCSALAMYDSLRLDPFHVLSFDLSDEQQARELLNKYHDQRFSFHDALCAVLMLREGIYKIFTFDKDFWVMGFEVMPGRTF